VYYESELSEISAVGVSIFFLKVQAAKDEHTLTDFFFLEGGFNDFFLILQKKSKGNSTKKS
jgi:hypothetical protein